MCFLWILILFLIFPYISLCLCSGRPMADIMIMTMMNFGQMWEKHIIFLSQWALNIHGYYSCGVVKTMQVCRIKSFIQKNTKRDKQKYCLVGWLKSTVFLPGRVHICGRYRYLIRGNQKMFLTAILPSRRNSSISTRFFKLNYVHHIQGVTSKDISHILLWWL